MIEAPSNPVARAGRAGRQIDWEAIEREYRAGQLSVREIARRFGVGSAGTIIKHAKKFEWEQDLTDRVRQATAARLALETARGNTDRNTVSAREAVQIAAARGVEVVRQHRATLTRLADTAMRLHAAVDRLLGGPDGDAEVPSMDAADLAARTIESLARTAERQQKLERVAFSLDADLPGRDSGGHVVVAVAGASLDALSPAQLDAVETAHAALRAVGVAGESK